MVCFMVSFFFLLREDKKISEDSTHPLPALALLLLAERCIRSSWCDNR